MTKSKHKINNGGSHTQSQLEVGEIFTCFFWWETTRKITVANGNFCSVKLSFLLVCATKKKQTTVGDFEAETYCVLVPVEANVFLLTGKTKLAKKIHLKLLQNSIAFLFKFRRFAHQTGQNVVKHTHN